jgi:lipoate-protein ligase A
MDCFFLDRVPWDQSQSLYHAAAHLGREALFLLRPETPYVCVGFHQDVEQEIDLDYAQAHTLPVFRREVGGGAVYLDSGQLFYQLVTRPDRPGIPASKEAFFRVLLEPVVETFRAFGLPAVFKPANDILVNGRKISGNGAAEIQGMDVLVGNFILDFDFESMSRVLRVPDEKFRDKVYKTLAQNLTTIRAEAVEVPEASDLAGALIERFTPILGPFIRHQALDGELTRQAQRRFKVMHRPEWLFQNDQRRGDLRRVKIREGVEIVQTSHKAPGGLIRVTARREEGRLHDLHISGDFFIFPPDSIPALERRLEGQRLDPGALTQEIERFFTEYGVEAPGMSPPALAQAILPQGS